MLMASFVMGQTIEAPLHAIKHDMPVQKFSFPDSKTPTDTILMNEFFLAGQPTLYGNQGGGYVFGTNVIDTASMTGLTIDAQGYQIAIGPSSGQYGIEEVLIWVGAIQQISGAGSSLTCKVTAIDAASTYTLGGTSYNIACPGTVKGTTTIPWSDIDTTSGNVTVATFATPVFVNMDYAITMDLSNFYTNHDTIGFVTSADAGASATEGVEYTWVKYSTKWYQASHVYSGLDLCLAFWPVVDVNYVGIESDYYANGIKLSCNPNPVKSDATIQYAIEKDSKVTVEVYNTRGQVMMSFEQGKQVAGQYSVAINADKLSNGNYYVSVKSDNNRLTKKMIVSK